MTAELDQYLAGLLPRLVGCSPAAVDRLAAGGPVLDTLCDHGVVSRVAARAIRLAFADRYDETDLKQLLQPARVRAGIYRLAAAAEPTPATTLSQSATPSANRDALLRLGDRLGKFEVRGFLGRGASGSVYLANHAALGIPVALKVFDPAGLPTRGRHAEQFRTEAAVLARLSHPNLLRLYDFEEGDPPFMALEFVHGQSLQQLIQHEGALPPDRVFTVVAQTIRALRAAHRAGVAHLDVKPANILVALDGTVKLADFGIARLRGPDRTPSDGSPRPVQGTLAYMAPEQFTNAGDHRSDVYALGLVLHHALSGQPPVVADGFAEYARLHATHHPAPLDRPPTSAPPAVARLVERLTRKDPDDRPDSYSDILDALEGAFGLRLESL